MLGGDSAGANIAIGVALLLRETDPALTLRGLLLNYGVFDADLDTPSYREFADGYFLTRDKMRFYWDCYCPRRPDRLNPLAARCAPTCAACRRSSSRSPSSTCWRARTTRWRRGCATPG